MKFIKSDAGIISLAISAMCFVIYMFFFGGLEKVSHLLTFNQVLILFFGTVFVIIVLFIRKLSASFKWWKESDKWRDEIKIGSKAYLSTLDGGEDVEVIDVDDDTVTIKAKVNKSRIYKPFNK